MKETPLVSVAIITYNQKEFLREAIESVLNQEYQHTEIVIGDDCSSDGTQDMLRKYSEKYPGRFVLRLAAENLGITPNSNVVHFACTGKYIAWLGGDDLMHKDKLRKQVEYMESHPGCSIVYHNLEVFESSTGKLIRYFNTPKDSYHGDIGVLIKYGTFNGACSNLVRRACTPAGGYNEKLAIASDWLYFIETLDSGGTIDYINEVLGKYRRHDKNVSGSQSEFYRRGIIDHLTTAEILLQRYPQYKKEIAYRLSTIHRMARRLDYSKNLLASIRYNVFNIPAWIMLGVYYATFTKIKL